MKHHQRGPVQGESMEADLVVIGGGATGLCAAVSAAEKGARVILLEKQGHCGGSTNFSEGLFGVESGLQRRQRIGLSCDEAFKMIMDFSHWRADPRLVRAFVDESAATIAWLQKQGVEFEGPEALLPDGCRTWHLIRGPAKARGSAMIRKLVAQGKKQGLDFRFKTPAIKILKQNGRVSGLVAKEKGEEIRINTPVVVIATGGYANNQKWIKKYTGFDLDQNLFPIGNRGKTGDGIRMAWEAGAAAQSMGLLQLVRSAQGLKTGGNLEVAGLQPNLYVDPQGQRYCDESIGLNFTFDGNAVARLKEHYSFSIFDESAKKEMVQNGIVAGMGRVMPSGTRLTALDRELTAALDEKNPTVFAADSLAQLAQQMGMDAAILKATIETYNRFCRQERDALFAKNPIYLRPLKKPKFYAVKFFTGFLSTLGGIRINPKMEVVDERETPIPGLYAGGNDAGGLYGDSYDVCAAGKTLGFAVNSGRIAAKSALKYLQGGFLSPPTQSMLPGSE